MSKIDYNTPNASAVSWMDAYFQNHDKLSRRGEQIANKYYHGAEGWDEVEKSDMIGAFYEYKALKESHGLSDDDMENF